MQNQEDSNEHVQELHLSPHLLVITSTVCFATVSSSEVLPAERRPILPIPQLPFHYDLHPDLKPLLSSLGKADSPILIFFACPTKASGIALLIA